MAELRPRRRRWLALALFALVANPFTLIGGCAASFGMSEPGVIIESDAFVIYEKWTYRIRGPRPGDEVAARHPTRDVDLVGQLALREADQFTITGRSIQEGGSVSSYSKVVVPRTAINGKVIGSLGGSGDEDLLAITVLVTPWILGFVMLCVAIAWAERIRRRAEGSNRWFPLPLLLWGLGTALYAWRMRHSPGTS